MYFPYIRGRQYELLALKELIINNRLSEHITPIVEPVKLSSTLSKTMEEFVNRNRNLCLICNPAVGSFISDMNNDDVNNNKQKILEFLSTTQIIKSHIIKENSAKNLNYWENKRDIKKSDWYVINTNREYLTDYLTLFEDISPKMSFIPDESQFRRKIRRNRSLLEDRFNKCERNSDYLAIPDEFFTKKKVVFCVIAFGSFCCWICCCPASL